MKVALVTGAAAGIGKACAVRLAREGIAVGVLDLDLAASQAVAAEIEAVGGKRSEIKSKRQSMSCAVPLARSLSW